MGGPKTILSRESVKGMVQALAFVSYSGPSLCSIYENMDTFISPISGIMRPLADFIFIYNNDTMKEGTAEEEVWTNVHVASKTWLGGLKLTRGGLLPT